MKQRPMHLDALGQEAPGLAGLMVAVLVQYPGLHSVYAKDGAIVLTVVMKETDSTDRREFGEQLDRHQAVLETCLDTEFFRPDIDWELLTGFSRVFVSWPLENFVSQQAQLVLELLWSRFSTEILVDGDDDGLNDMSLRHDFMEEQLEHVQWDSAETLIAYREGGRVLVYTVPAAGQEA